MRDNGGLNYGNNFAESVEISAAHLNQLFGMLLATLLCTLLLGNLLFRDWEILRAAVRVAAVCAGFICVFYSVSKHFNSLAWGIVCLYGIILAVVYCRSPFANALFYIVAGAACVYALRFVRIQKTAYWYALAAGITGAVTTLGARGAYISFNLLKSVMERGAHQDILYHASIASMIKNYGITSTGLHGLVETPYHVLSHQLMAAISSLSGVGVLETYGIAIHLFIVPLLFFSITAFAVSLNRDKDISALSLWSMACFVLVIIPHFLEYNFGHYQFYLASESYAVSLSLLLLGMTLLYKRHLSLADMPLICFFGFLCASAKISVGLIYMGLWWIRTLFFIQKGTAKIALAAMALSVVTVLTGYSMIAAGVGVHQFGPFLYVERFSFWGQYIRQFNKIYLATDMVHWPYLMGALASIGLFAVMHFIVSWAAIGQSLYKKGLAALWRSPAALYSLGAAGAGFLAVGLLSNASAYYFSSVSLFVSLPTVLLVSYAAVTSLRLKRIGQYKNLLVPLAAFAFIMMINYPSMYYTATGHAKIRNATNAFVTALIDIRDNGALDQCLSPTAALTAQNPVTSLLARPLTYPAISERPWINVVPENTSAQKYELYSYEQYGITPAHQAITMAPALKINGKRSLKIVPAPDFMRVDNTQ